MRNIIKAFLLILITLYSCADPYENSTYQVYEVQPVSSYLETRTVDFSEWIKVLKYADLFNAVNQASESFTVFVPNNAAVEAFYKKKGVDSIQVLGKEYARSLAQYHIIGDSISLEKMIAGGKLDAKTLSDDYLSVTFDDTAEKGGGFNSIYLNKEAHITEPAIQVSNGYVYVLSSVLRPLVETVYERINEKSESYSILKEALDLTDWKDSLNTIYDEIKQPNGSTLKQKRNYTLLAVTDDAFHQSGINSIDDLIGKLKAGENYKSTENELFQYVAYHIIDGNYSFAELTKFDDGNSKIWDTAATDGILKISQEEDQKYYINYAGDEVKAMFIENASDIQAKNGTLHQIDSYLPIWQSEEATTVYFDFCNYPALATYIASKGTTGQIYQTINSSNEYRTEVTKLSCYNVEISSSGVGSTSSYNYLDYFTVKSGNNWSNSMYNDQLIVNIGYMGSISMKTPVIVAGKYKVTLRMGFATSMDFIRTMSDGSNGGQMKFSFDNENATTVAPYTSVTEKVLDLYDSVIYDELEFTKTSAHTLKIVVADPAASTQAKFRLQFDYLLFEPINK